MELSLGKFTHLVRFRTFAPLVRFRVNPKSLNSTNLTLNINPNKFIAFDEFNPQECKVRVRI